MQGNNHDYFLENLEYSRPAVGATVPILTKRRYGVYVPPDLTAPNFEDRSKYTDDNDIIITKDGRSWRIEVKRLKVNFNSHSWPFGHMFIVDRVVTLDKKKHKPAMYFVWSADLKAYARFSMKHEDKMFRSILNNPTNRCKAEYYLVHKNLVKFFDLV